MPDTLLRNLAVGVKGMSEAAKRLRGIAVVTLVAALALVSSWASSAEMLSRLDVVVKAVHVLPVPATATAGPAVGPLTEQPGRPTNVFGLAAADATDLYPEASPPLAHAAGHGPKRGLASPIPESYMDLRSVVDMEPARGLPGSTLNAAGEVRNANYFWRQLLKRRPEMFSKGNVYKIEELGLSPKVDPTWVAHNPSHASFLREVLHHHHINQGRMAVPLPEPIHEAWTSVLHGR